MVAGGFVKTGHQMGAAGTGGAATHAETSGELRLPGGGESAALLVAHTDPLDVAAADGISERIERIADQSEKVSDADLLQRTDQNIRHRPRHRRLRLRPPAKSINPLLFPLHDRGAYRPDRASECTQPCMRFLALAMSSLENQSSGFTRSTG